ncbi:hypothetical protein G3O08_02115 [Cryomorpha ignava]|uniref:Uncharacterized protein n=1 Tax=Cryomorpha ignava TaxID=101383 RepID=A0A7K3WL92_9FLAO|nr:hypothetical protein [Cryomorpha ignava]NEN22298.1 hypothetical protein [Cryomorpha ignava]
MTDKKVIIALTQDEAVVLYDYLTRFNSQDNNVPFDDQAEQRVLWDIESMLEKEMVASLKTNYQDIVKQARDNIRDNEK